MNATSPTARTYEPPFWRRPLFWGLVIVCGIYAVAILGAVRVVSFFRLSPDGRAVRESIVRAGGASWHKKVEISAGAVSVGLARFGLSFVDQIPREARTALQALKGAEVGVYERSAAGDMGSRSSMLTAADRAMTDRGWERVVGVMDRHDLVLVYVPKDLRSARRTRVCVAVVNERDLVVAVARADLEPLLQLARDSLGQQHIAFLEHAGLR
jgi:hypothetical protein